MGDTELQQLVKIGASGGRNPVQETRYQQLLKEQGQNSGGNTQGVASAPSFQDTLNNATQIRQATIEANKPAVATLQQNSTNLDSRYKDLITSIKGASDVASEQQTRTTAGILASRGIAPQSGIGGQEISTALRPIAANTQQILGQTGLSQQEQQNAIQNAIAALQTGDPNASIASALALSGQQAGITSAQIGAAPSMLSAQTQARYITIPGYGVYDTQEQKMLGGVNSQGMSPSGYSIGGVWY